MAASIATEINIHLCKHLFTLLCVTVSPYTSPFVVQAHDYRMRTWCMWLPWISRSVRAIRRPYRRTAWRQWKHSIVIRTSYLSTHSFTLGHPQFRCATKLGLNSLHDGTVGHGNDFNWNALGPVCTQSWRLLSINRSGGPSIIQCESQKRKPRFNFKSLKNEKTDHRINNKEW